MSSLHELELRRRDLCFIDTETTGAQFGYHEIIEIAGVRTDESGTLVRSTWARRLKPHYPERISAVALKLTHYTPAAWENAHVPSQALWEDFAEFARGCIPICHNPSFDRAFITLTALQSGVTDLGLDYHWIGTESLGWPIYVRSRMPKLSLAHLCGELRVDAEPEIHNALDGALACRRLYLQLMKQFRPHPSTE